MIDYKSIFTFVQEASHNHMLLIFIWLDKMPGLYWGDADG